MKFYVAQTFFCQVHLGVVFEVLLVVGSKLVDKYNRNIHRFKFFSILFFFKYVDPFSHFILMKFCVARTFWVEHHLDVVLEVLQVVGSKPGSEACRYLP